MKARLVQRTVVEGASGGVHGESYTVPVVVVPELDNLAIVFDHGMKVHFWTGFTPHEGDRVVREDVEIPDELAREAREFVQSKDSLETRARQTLRGLYNSP